MIEVWCAKAWNGLAPSRRRIFDGIKGLPSKKSAIVLTLTVPTLVFLWHLAALACRPVHFNKIVSELGSATIGRFYTLMPDHSEESLAFMQAEENGYGIYLCKIGEGKRILIDEDLYSQKGSPHQTLLGWSPDDDLFAFSRYKNRWEIVICDGETGETRATIPINDKVLYGTWLSPQKLAFVNRGFTIFTVNGAKRKWDAPKPLFGKRESVPIQNVTALGANAVAWQQGNTIWSCGESSPVPVKIWDSKTNFLIQFSLSSASNKILLNYQNTKGQFLACFHLGQPDRLEDVTRVNTNEYHVGNLTLINNGKGYAFLSQIGTSNILFAKWDDSRDLDQFVWPDQISRFVPGQHEIFVASSLNNGPTGIWKYDLASGSADCVVPRADDNLFYNITTTAEWNHITNSSGNPLTYYLYVPPGQVSKQKHPLIIGVDGIAPAGFAWNPNFQGFADCGYFYAYVERYQRDYFEWGQDVLSVYKRLAKRPDIDTNRVYLYGVSAGTGPVSELLSQKPGLWRGAVLLSAGALPDPFQIPGKRIFVDGGGLDPGFNQRVRQFQQNAAKAGIPVTLMIFPGLDHMLNRTPYAEKEQFREVMLFLNAS